MRIHTTFVPLAALALALGSFSTASAQEDRARSEREARRGARADRGDRGRQSQGDTRSRSDDSGRQRSGDSDSTRSRDTERNADRGDRAAVQRDNSRDQRSGSYGGSYDRSSSDRYRDDSRNRYQGDNRSRYQGNNRNRYQDRDRDRYFAPRFSLRPAPRRYYGRGGGLSLYFGIGSGYRYGSPYSGRVYGYRQYAYRNDQYFGDVRLRIQPREAAVYVDGYYAGIVDDFDGIFQRLTLEVGPHQIEVEARGLEPQVFDVYVDPDHTVDLRADLLR
jgi:hypothetical protein